jgi:hypothetical protein
MPMDSQRSIVLPSVRTIYGGPFDYPISAVSIAPQVVHLFERVCECADCLAAEIELELAATQAANA